MEQIIRNIADKCTTNDLKLEEPGLYHGPAGVALFLAYYSMHTGEEQYGERAVELLSDAVNTLDGSTSLYDGMAGVGWAIQHLVNVGFFDYEQADNLDAWDKHLYESMLRDFDQGEYDLMHAGIGKGLYFLERYAYNPRYTNQLVGATDSLLRLAKRNNKGIFWELVGDPGVVSTGMAHGMASVIRFLGEIHVMDINQGVCKKYILRSLDWLDSMKLYGKQSLLQAQYRLEKKEDKRSNFFWCHGDLGTALALTWLGNNSNLLREKDKLFLEEVLKKAGKRTLQDSGIFYDKFPDLSFCHGLAGAYHIMGRLSLDQGYWHTLLNENIKNVKDVTLHSGLAGIGLTLLDNIMQKQVRPWDLYMLTNTNRCK